MTFAELNEVRTLKKQIATANQKISALRESSETITTKLNLTPKGKSVDSRVEVIATLIVDEEAAVNEMQARLQKAVPALTEKILSEVSDGAEQTLLIYRYVACEYFRDIGILMGHSEQWVYWKHNRILKKIRVDYS